jgi:hypothetical protein
MQAARVTAALTFFPGEQFAGFRVSDVNQRFPMSVMGRLSVVTAYIAIAFVGAIVLGVI